MTKTIGIVVAAIIIAVAGYFLMMQPASQTSMQAMPEAAGEQPAGEQATGDSMPMGKLNINAVCDGALTYMTFPDGDAAAKFVAECKAGEHPEVIEKYKADMNLGDGAQI